MGCAAAVKSVRCSAKKTLVRTKVATSVRLAWPPTDARTGQTETHESPTRMLRGEYPENE